MCHLSYGLGLGLVYFGVAINYAYAEEGAMGVKSRVKDKVKDYLKGRGFYKEVADIIADNQDLLQYRWFVRPGHFYSPLVDHDAIDHDQLIDLWNLKQKIVPLPGIDLNKDAQLALLKKLSVNTPDLVQYTTQKGIRFKFDNDQFGFMDMSFLYLMLRHIKPKKVIEVGSGWSSSLMLDVNEQFPKSAAHLTFVEPYPDRLYSALRKGDKKLCTIIEKPVQQADQAQFQKLGPNDILFIDNSHVSKTGSDVNHLFLDVLPSLKKGVVIHIHDIFYPFEYPLQWVVEEKRNWNEIYTLRALLIGSNMFEIIMWPSYLKALNKKKLEQYVPPATDFGGSIWLRKIS